jgi:hypothetical protein
MPTLSIQPAVALGIVGTLVFRLVIFVPVEFDSYKFVGDRKIQTIFPDRMLRV